MLGQAWRHFRDSLQVFAKFIVTILICCSQSLHICTIRRHNLFFFLTQRLTVFNITVGMAGMVDNMANTLDPAVVQFSDQDDLDSAVVAFHCRV